MREYVRAAAVANRVRMLPHTGVFLLVEGGEDARVYGSFVDPAVCRMVVAHGKTNVLGALNLLKAQDPRLALGIVDADFMMLDNNVPSDPDVIVTDLHDLEAILLASPALERVIREYSDDDAGPRAPASEIRERLLQLGLPIGLLRWLSQREGRGWLFEDMDFDRFVDEKDLSLSTHALLGELQVRSRKGVLDPADVLARIERLASINPDRWHVCCGHDLVALLAIGLRRSWGAHRDAEVTRERVERSLRLAYTQADFAATRVHAGLRAWEQSHPPHRFLSSG